MSWPRRATLTALVGILGLFLLWTAIEKATHFDAFVGRVAAHGLMSQTFIPAIARAVVTFEAAAGACAISSVLWVRVRPISTILLMSAFACFLTYSSLLWYWSGPAADCACSRAMATSARGAAIRAALTLLGLGIAVRLDQAGRRTVRTVPPASTTS